MLLVGGADGVADRAVGCPHQGRCLPAAAGPTLAVWLLAGLEPAGGAAPLCLHAASGGL